MRSEYQPDRTGVDSEGALQSRQQWPIEGLNRTEKSKDENAGSGDEPLQVGHVDSFLTVRFAVSMRGRLDCLHRSIGTHLWPRRSLHHRAQSEPGKNDRYPKLP